MPDFPVFPGGRVILGGFWGGDPKDPAFRELLVAGSSSVCFFAGMPFCMVTGSHPVHCGKSKTAACLILRHAVQMRSGVMVKRIGGNLKKVLF